MPKIYIEDDYDSSYRRFWSHLGEVVDQGVEFLRNPREFSLVCFTGGEDISPELYHHRNLASRNSAARDTREVMVFRVARAHRIPMTGICRGTQLLNVLCGGTMVQHMQVQHGGGRHGCLTRGGQSFQMSSAHHQMIVPGTGGEILAWSEEAIPRTACVYDGDLRDQNLVWAGEGENALHVTEAIAYPELKIFGVQGHPEWMNINEEGPQWALQMTRKICLGQEEMFATS